MKDILSEIASRTAQSIGTPFLAELVRTIRKTMDASLVFIAVGVGKPVQKAQSLSSWEKDGDNSSFKYDLDETPCRLVYRGQTLIISEGLYKRFPKEEGFDGYVGIPLKRADGSLIGHFAVLSKQPIANPDEALAVIRIFAMRAEAELQRMELQREMEELVETLSQTTRRLASRHKALHKSNEAKTALLGTMAHDLRNPLAVILSRSELIAGVLEKQGIDGDLAKTINNSSGIIAETVERMDRLIVSCLDRASCDAALLKLDVQDLPLDRACDLAIALNARTAAKKSISLVYTPPTGLSVRGDEDRLVEALDNLISNAIKYSHPGQSVFIDARKVAECTEITVRDQGLGMTESDRTFAFQHFQRLSAKPTAGETSTGLGLAIVKAIADAHGGSIRLDSPGQGEGTVFTLTLPDKPQREAPPPGEVKRVTPA